MASSGGGDGGDDNSDGVEYLARRYVKLHDDSLALQKSLRALTNELLSTLDAYEAVPVGPGVVLAHIDRPPARKPITQKLLKSAGVSEKMMKEVLDATDPGKTRVSCLKIMVQSAFEALRPPPRTPGGGSDGGGGGGGSGTKRAREQDDENDEEQ